MTKFLKMLAVSMLFGSITHADTGGGGRYNWPLYVYTFGGLDKYPVGGQVEIARSHGYDGLAINVSTVEKIGDLDSYLTVANKHDDFRIYSAFYRFNYDKKKGFSGDWVRVIDRLAGTDVDFWLMPSSLVSRI